MLLVDLLPHHHFNVLHLVGRYRVQNAGCRYSCFFVSIAQMILAALLAMAVVASRNGLSAMIFTVQRSTFSGERFAMTAREVILTTSSFRMYRSPFLLILPSFSLPPLVLLSGVKPSNAAKSRPVRN